MRGAARPDFPAEGVAENRFHAVGSNPGASCSEGETSPYDSMLVFRGFDGKGFAGLRKKEDDEFHCVLDGGSFVFGCDGFGKDLARAIGLGAAIPEAHLESATLDIGKARVGVDMPTRAHTRRYQDMEAVDLGRIGKTEVLAEAVLGGFEEGLDLDLGSVFAGKELRCSAAKGEAKNYFFDSSLEF